MTESTPFLDFHATKTLHTAQGQQLLDIRFQLKQGETLAIYGPSGAGKTTILRILAGLTDVQSGIIRLAGTTWLDTANRVHLPTRNRPIGFVFQDFALFPNLSVRQQLEYALPKTSDPAIIPELLALMELEALQNHRPALLSGGQQQRVALARAIARRPSLLLLDEPLSALDDEMRDKLQEYLGRIQKRFHLTTILVSHYLPEIFRLADTVIRIQKGRVIDHDAPARLFTPPSPAAFVPATATGSTIATLAQTRGKIIAIAPEGEAFVISVLIDDQVVKMPATAAEVANLTVGQEVAVKLEIFAKGDR